MLLRKRPRPPMKRTTSMTEFTLDLSVGGAPPHHPSDPFGVSSRNHRRNSSDFNETANFLRACSLCKRRLIPGRDIYMYKGDSAFCSLECRQQQMSQDERREKCSVSSKRESAHADPSGSDSVSAEGETVATV